MSAAPQGGAVTMILVRHGATLWNARGLLQGRRDIPLSPLGQEQAQAVARELQGCGAALVVCSPMQRAHATAEAIAAALSVGLIDDDELVERAFGPHEGKSRTELEALGLWPVRMLEGQGIEPLSALRERAVGALTRLAETYPGTTLVVVSHVAFLNAFLRAIDQAGEYSITNASISKVRYQPDAASPWQVVAVDITEHLS